MKFARESNLIKPFFNDIADLKVNFVIQGTECPSEDVHKDKEERLWAILIAILIRFEVQNPHSATGKLYLRFIISLKLGDMKLGRTF